MISNGRRAQRASKNNWRLKMRQYPGHARFSLPFVLAVLAFLLVLGCVPVEAQFSRTSLGGRVVDPSGAAIPNAIVTITSLQTGLTTTKKSASDGSFLFPNLPIQTYKLIVSKAGFTTHVQSGITLVVDQSANLIVKLTVGAMAQRVTVSANAAILPTTSATLSQLVGQREIVDLPLNGRQPEGLVFITAGANNASTRYGITTSQGGVVPDEQEAITAGGEQADVNYEMDGGDYNDTYINANLPFPNPDAVQEFSVQSANMSGEYGGSSVVVNILTKSGTNQFHGDAFEFVRNGDLDARTFLSPGQDTLKRNQFGGTFGGPIKKNHLFFFGTYQGTLQHSASVGTAAFVATAAERNGDFSAISTQLKDPVTGQPFTNNQIPPDLLSAPSLKILNEIPLPTVQANGETLFVGPSIVQDNEQWMAKIDYDRGRNTLSGRYFYADYTTPPDLAVSQRNLLDMFNSAEGVRIQTLALNDNFSASPTLLFNTWFGWAIQNGGTLSDSSQTFTDFGVGISAPPLPSINELSVPGFFTVEGGSLGNFNRGDWQIREEVTKIRGKHELRFGGDALRVTHTLENYNSTGGVFEFGGAYSGLNLADFMLGQASTFEQNAISAEDLVGTFYDLFLQDNWQATSKLTVNLGLRWDPYWPFSEADNRVECFIPGEKSARYPNAPVGMVFGGDPGCPAHWGTHSNLGNFDPRVGFAYRLSSNTALRFGAGIYFEDPQTSQQNGFQSTAPFSPAFTLTDVNWANPWASAGIANPFPAAFPSVIPGPSATFETPATITKAYQSDFHVPTMGTWNISLDRQLDKNSLLSIDYVANMGYYLSNSQVGYGPQLDPSIYIPGASTQANTQSRRPYPNFSSIGCSCSVFNSNYNALWLNVEKRFSHGLSFLANYAWSHETDNLPIANLATNPFDRDFDWGNSDNNIPNIVHLSPVWNIPHIPVQGFASRLLNGWELSSIVTWQNGLPFSILSGVNNSFSGIGYDRANFVGTSLSQAILPLRTNGKPYFQYLNPAYFVPNAVGTFGDTGKNIYRGPRYFDADMGLLKNGQISERVAYQFRFEAFNAFNNVDLTTGADMEITSTSFGELSGADDGRILQFAMKLIF
jgi:hypothetical protein